ncbi:MAG: 16S rRNA (cytidine1402-2'-O)-methyltransferase [Arenicella sp.]|jgi:16S rRNA (cytidine1402-2'-O)-methyltransferase
MHFASIPIILVSLFISSEVYRVSDPFSKDSPAVSKDSPAVSKDRPAVSKDTPVADSGESGQLLVVATPIGNLGDITHRALQVLSSVDVILAEDTRHSKRLLNHYAIGTKLRSCHEHNEESQVEWVKSKLDQGLDLALISDAGTPLISDPGFVLVRALRQQGYSIVAVPGPSSIIAALSIAGLPTDGFVYDGFLPSKSGARQTALACYVNQHRTTVLLESSHRIKACLADVVEVLGGSRQIAVARELTKRFETVLSGTAESVLETFLHDEDQSRGEFVLMLAGVEPVSSSDADVTAILKVLLADLPVKQAAALAAKLSGKRKNEVYDLALTVKAALGN